MSLDELKIALDLIPDAPAMVGREVMDVWPLNAYAPTEVTELAMVIAKLSLALFWFHGVLMYVSAS